MEASTLVSHYENNRIDVTGWWCARNSWYLDLPVGGITITTFLKQFRCFSANSIPFVTNWSFPDILDNTLRPKMSCKFCSGTTGETRFKQAHLYKQKQIIDYNGK